MKSVEAPAFPATLTHIRRPAMRQVPKPRALFRLEVGHVHDGARAIGDKIAEVARARGCGAFLFVDPDLDVYVVHEEQPVALEWVRDRFTWLVGFYTAAGGRSRTRVQPMDVGRLHEDLTEHLEVVG